MKIIRQRLWYNHTSATEREIINEFMIENDGNNPMKDIILFDLPLMLKLEIFDETDSRLSFLPNSLVKEKLEPLSLGTDERSKRLHTSLNKKNLYPLWIRLQKNSTIPINGHKIIRLKYRETQEPKTAKFYSTLASVSRYNIDVHKSIREEYDVFIMISAPSGYILTYDITNATINNAKMTDDDGFYKTKREDFLQIRIPPSSKKMECEIIYDVQPPKLEKRFVKLTLIGLAVVSAFLVVIAIDNGIFYSSSNEEIVNLNSFLQSNYSTLKPIYEKILKNMFEISSLVSGASVAIAGFVRNPLLARVRVLYLGTFLTAIIAFILH